MKSMCQEVRRNSPSVAERSPTSACIAHDVADGLVLDDAQLVGGDPPSAVLGPGLQQVLRPQQAADVVGPERWGGAQRHGRRS